LERLGVGLVMGSAELFPSLGDQRAAVRQGRDTASAWPACRLNISTVSKLGYGCEITESLDRQRIGSNHGGTPGADALDGSLFGLGDHEIVIPLLLIGVVTYDKKPHERTSIKQSAS
jgi:hypothetical protein